MRRCLRDPKFSRYDTIPECDRQTHTHRHTTTAYTALSKASRGKNKRGPPIAVRRSSEFSAGVFLRSCEGVDSLRVSITSSDGERSDVGVYCADRRPPMLMSGQSGSLHVTLTSRSSTAAAAATRSGFSANFSFVTGA